MSNPSKFVTDLQAVDIDRISKEAVLKSGLITASQSFTVESIKAKGMAAACLADWAINVVEYYEMKNKLDGIPNDISTTRQMHPGEEVATENTEERIPQASGGLVVKDKAKHV